MIGKYKPNFSTSLYDIEVMFSLHHYFWSRCICEITCNFKDTNRNSNYADIVLENDI